MPKNNIRFISKSIIATSYKKSILSKVLLILFTISSNYVYATNGYFRLGYSAQSRAMGGAGVAAKDDLMAAASNPAAMRLVNEGYSASIDLFSPVRESSVNCNGIGACNTTVSDGSSTELFPIPSLGYIRYLDDRSAVGIAIYANGGMHTKFDRNIFDETFGRINGFAGNTTGAPNVGSQGVDLSQLMIAPSYSRQFGNHHFGLSVIGAMQRFRAYGLGAAASLSADGGSFTNRGFDYSYGVGFRLGWLSTLNQQLTLAASYTSRLYMTEFDKYSGLFAEQGDFDIPAQLTLGMAFKATDATKLLLDIQHIFYGEVASISNPIFSATELNGVIATSRRLGNSSGIGFGWKNIWTIKTGISHQFSDKITLRAGFAYNEEPFDSESSFLNIIAPATIKYHVTAGVSYQISQQNRIDLTYVRAMENDINTTQPIGAAVNLSMYQNSFGVNFVHHF